MTWTIEKIQVPPKYTYAIVGADCAGRDGVYAVGTLFSSKIIVVVPGIGYIQFEDKGNTVSGPGDWSVKVSNSTTNWFYQGGGVATLTVNKDGSYSISGGSNAVNAKVVAWQN